jgi:hypothetical protein
VVQRGCRSSFADEAFQRIGVELRALRKNLQDELALEKGVASPVDLSHAAGREPAYDFVPVDAASRSQ